MSQATNIEGIWLPLITPFKDGEVDLSSTRKLVRHYAEKGITGLILAATTGEGQLISNHELEKLVETCVHELSDIGVNIPTFISVSGNNPKKVISQLEALQTWPIDGYLLNAPHYMRPSQEGLIAYFSLVAGTVDKPIILYNIPYRTGVNINNDTMLALSKIKNIVGVKDCGANSAQSYELMRTAPEGFSVLTGEDPFFYNAIVHGASGAIVTGAHILLDTQIEIISNLKNGLQKEALSKWNTVAHIPQLLFAEPSPAPLKYWLAKQGLIESAEVRLPLLPISDALKLKIDTEIDQS